MAYIDWWNRTGPITMGERFGLNEISTRANTLSPTKSYARIGTLPTFAPEEIEMPIVPDLLREEGIQVGPQVKDGGRIGFSRGTEVEFAKLPGVQARSIELLNEGLTLTEAARTLEAEGLLKFKTYFNKLQGKNVTSYNSITPYFKRLLAEGELDIKEFGKQSQQTIKRNVQLVKIIKNNLDLNQEQIAKKASVDLNYKISPSVIRRLAKKENIDIVSRHAKLFPEFEYLDQLIKKHKKYLSTSIKEISSYKKEQFLFNEMKKKFGKNYNPNDFINRLQRLGEIYVQGPGRYEIELYKKIKAPLNYTDSMLHKNLVGVANRSFLGVVAKAKMLDLPKNQIQLLEDVLGGSKALTKMHIAGDHTDIDALMKNFGDYKKNFTRINIISHKLNNIKLASDQKLINLVKSFNTGLIQPDEFKQKVQEIRTKFINQTKIPISNPQIKGGKIVLNFQTPRLIDLKNPRNKTILRAMNNLVTEGVKFKGIDQELMFANTIKERLNILKNAGIDQLKNSKYIKAFAEMSGEVGKAANTILKTKSGKAATVVGLYSLLSSIASASEKDETLETDKQIIEPGDKTLEAGVTDTGWTKGEIASGITLGAAGTAISNYPKKSWELAKKVGSRLDKMIAPFLTPTISAVVRGPHKPDVTSGLEWITPAFWNAMTKRFGLTGTIEAFKKAPSAAAKTKLAIDMLLRAGIPMKLLPIISAGATTVAAPLLVSDAAKALQKSIDKQGLTGIIEEQSGMIGDEAGASLFMEDVWKEKKRRDAEGMDYAQGGIASLIK